MRRLDRVIREDSVQPEIIGLSSHGYNSPMTSVFAFAAAAFASFFRGKRALVLENLALRQQLAVYRRVQKRPRLRSADRVFWVWLSRLWDG
jgi:hypothetical protein